MPTPRSYESSHAWITFTGSEFIRKLDPMTWAHLGESFSKCQHLMGVPLKPAVADDLAEIYLRRGALASAAIEGNTLSEEEVKEIITNDRSLPGSQQYLEQEVRNVWDTLHYVEEEVAKKPFNQIQNTDDFQLTPEWIKNIHTQLLENLELETHVKSGEYREISVGVGGYLGAPAEDLDFLMDKFCIWINALRADATRENEKGKTDLAFIHTFFAAAFAHLYFAWIHPFGDGNGRTARLIECAILAHSGFVPWISTNVLSDFYNKTRTRYYQRLDAASKRLEVHQFIQYSAEGFRDQLRDQVAVVQKYQRDVAWENYVHEVFQDEPSSPATKRRRKLILAMPENEQISTKDMRVLNPALAEMYIGASEKLMRRDIGKLVELGLATSIGKGKFQVRIQNIDAFKPQPEFGSHNHRPGTNQ